MKERRKRREIAERGGIKEKGNERKKKKREGEERERRTSSLGRENREERGLKVESFSDLSFTSRLLYFRSH